MTCRIFEAKQPYIAMGAFIDQSSLLIGDVEVGEESSIWPLAILRGDVQAVRVGMKTNIQDGCILNVVSPSERVPNGYPLVIGDFVSIGHQSALNGCTIGHNVLIGAGTIILEGAVIPSNTIIAAGSVVSSDIKLEAGYSWAGSPLQQSRKLTKEDVLNIKAIAEEHVLLKNRYLLEFQRQREREREKF